VSKVSSQRFDDARPDREVGDEMPVHHVDMDVIGPRRIDRMHFLAEL
jgi:hypothetical protein